MREYGKELLEILERELQELTKRNVERDNRVVNGDVELDDCFVSTWAGRLNQQLLEAKIKILRDGGVAEVSELYYSDGTATNARFVLTRYGGRYLVVRPDGSEEWVNPYLRREVLAKRGYEIKTVSRSVWAKIGNGGRGLAGAANCRVVVYPTPTNYWTGK